jgi:predicted RNA methylase
MAINKNHEFEELDGVKCGIVEKNVKPERVDFLKKILEFNKFTVVVVPSPPPKAAPVAKPVEARPDDPVGRGEEIAVPQPEVKAPETFTVGVTDYTFNTINAIFGRSLKTSDGHIVTLAYWQQKENVSHDEIPYYEKNPN